MPVKFYSGEDFGGGLKIVNTPDPVNPQDAATKNYVDTHVPTPFSKQILWETSYSMTCSANNYGGSWAALYSGPSPQTITKLRADTGIRVKLGGTCYITPAQGQVYYGVGVGTTALAQVFVYWINTTNHSTYPWTELTMTPGNYSQLAVTGALQITFFVATGSGITWHTDANDYCSWTIAEVMP